MSKSHISLGTDIHSAVCQSQHTREVKRPSSEQMKEITVTRKTPRLTKSSLNNTVSNVVLMTNNRTINTYNSNTRSVFTKEVFFIFMQPLRFQGKIPLITHGASVLATSPSPVLCEEEGNSDKGCS